MSQKWRKLGLLYSPPQIPKHAKAISHATNPLPIWLEKDIYRIFFSARDAHNRSSVFAVDIDILKKKIVHQFNTPLFEHGSVGKFHAEGVSIGNCYEVNGITYMLFMGWQNPSNAHWRGDIGRLIVTNNLNLQLEGDISFLGSDHTDPISLSYPYVLKIDDHTYHMWYGSTLSWDTDNGEMLHVIQHATSKDGHNWQRLGLAIPYELGKAQAFSRPCVLKNHDNTGYKMWFSYRSGTGEKYRIGYAHCGNDFNWTLALEQTGIDVSMADWDSEMIEYPFVFDHNGERYMLYNGNGYGKTGFGLAILEYDE